MKRLRVILVCLLAVALIAWRLVTDYSVPAGTDLNTFLRTATAGDTFILQDGDYSGGIWISERNGNALQPITLRAEHAGKARIVGSSATRSDGLTLYKSAWWVLDGVVFTGAKNAGIRVSTSDHTTITNCLTISNGVFGLLTGSSSYGMVSGSNFLFNTEQHGAYVSSPGSVGWTFDHCNFAWNGRAGLQINSQGAPGPPASDCRVTNCSINNNGQLNQAAAINCLGVVNSVFESCTIHDNLAGGISFGPNGRPGGESTGNLVTNCAITFQAGTGRSCIQTTGGTQTAVNNRLWAGRAPSVPILALSGGTIVQSGNTVLPVAGTTPSPLP